MAEQNTYLIDGANRRWFLKQSSALAGFFLMPPLAATATSLPSEMPVGKPSSKRSVTLRINRKLYKLDIEPRETLLDVLRERLNLTGSKKGCDHGQCGACTVHLDGRAVNACLLLAIMHQGQEITTIEGLAPGEAVSAGKGIADRSPNERLHPLQAAFIQHDGFQCGFCTPGQIMSGVAVLKEGHANSTDEIREWMSGNICRCGAYEGIVNAIESVQKGGIPG